MVFVRGKRPGCQANRQIGGDNGDMGNFEVLKEARVGDVLSKWSRSVNVQGITADGRLIGMPARGPDSVVRVEEVDEANNRLKVIPVFEYDHQPMPNFFPDYISRGKTKSDEKYDVSWRNETKYRQKIAGN